jgi:hypothetical protein
VNLKTGKGLGTLSILLRADAVTGGVRCLQLGDRWRFRFGSRAALRTSSGGVRSHPSSG